MRFDVRNESGATAIEYAVIAGLIGLGIVGSLVSTRNSVSSVLGKASSQVGSSTGSGAPASLLPGNTSLFASKTIASKNSQLYGSIPAGTGESRDTITFTDGSSISRAKHYNTDGSDKGHYEYYMINGVTGDQYRFYSDTSGSIIYFFKADFDSSHTTIGSRYSDAPFTTMSVTNYADRSFTSVPISQEMRSFIAASESDRVLSNVLVAGMS